MFNRRKNNFSCNNEPYAGSDVANIQTTAVLQDKVYIVNGMKKWITNGLFCDYFTTLFF